MARTIQEIQTEILQAKESEPALAELNSTSKTAIWRLWIYIVSVAIWTLEKIFDQHKKEVDDKLARLKPGTVRWYHSKALAFQYGFPMYTESDEFDNTGFTQEEIEASKIVKYCAVVDVAQESRIVIKVATEIRGQLLPITEHEYEAFSKYINEIKYAGVYVTILNNKPDILRLKVRIVRDAMLLDSNGMEVSSGRHPVKEAIQNYMKRLPFNGELSLQALTDEIQQVPGVVDLSIDLAESKWINGSIYGEFSPINISKVPESGYFVVNFENQDETQSTIKFL